MLLYGINQNGNKFCGPSVVSALAGIGTKEAATLLRQITGRDRIMGTHDSHINKALQQLGFSMTMFRAPLNSTGAYKKLNLRHWAKNYASGKDVYLLNAGNHWVLVQGRYAMCGKTKNLVAVSDHPNVRTFVKTAYRITKLRDVKPEAVIPKKDTTEATARRKSRALAAANNVGLTRLHQREAFPLEVWPYGGIGDTKADPYYGDHHVDSWAEVLVRLEKYAAIRQAAGDGAAPVPAPRDTHAEAQALAAKHGISIEQDEGGNGTIWVYPPDSMSEDDDPYVEEHYVDTWAEALDRVTAYAALTAIDADKQAALDLARAALTKAGAA